MNEFQKAQNAKILSCYNTDENLSELTKSEILDIEKGGKRALIGEKRMFGGREYIKTSDGWKFHGKGTGTKAQEHAAGATSTEKPEEKVESTSLPKVDDIYAHPESGKKYRVRAVNKETGKIKYKQEGSELTQETDIKKFTEMLKPAFESPKAEESTSTDSHSAAEIKKKALEIMRAKGNADVKLSDFTIRQAKQVIKEHEMLGSKETPKTEKVAEEKKVSSEDIEKVKSAISQLNARWSPGVHREALETGKSLAKMTLKRITGFETVRRAEKWLEKNQ